MNFKDLEHECENPTYTIDNSISTMAYYPPVYNQEGENINPDQNETTTTYRCLKCNRIWNIKE